MYWTSATIVIFLTPPTQFHWYFWKFRIWEGYRTKAMKLYSFVLDRYWKTSILLCLLEILNRLIYMHYFFHRRRIWHQKLWLLCHAGIASRKVLCFLGSGHWLLHNACRVRPKLQDQIGQKYWFYWPRSHWEARIRRSQKNFGAFHPRWHRLCMSSSHVFTNSESTKKFHDF